MAHKDYNKKAPKDGISNKKVTPQYPYVYGEWDESGGHHFVYRNPKDGKTYRQKLNPSGGYSFTESDNDVKEGHFEINPGNKHVYTGAGKSDHVDGHYDFNAVSTARFESAGDFAMATAMNLLKGIGGQKVEIVKNAMAKLLGGGSSGSNVDGTNGNRNKVIKGNDYAKVEGDVVNGFEGKFLQMVNKNAAMYFNQNWDAFANQKLKLESKQAFQAFSQDTMFMQSDQDMTANSGANFITKSKQDTKISAQGSINANAQSQIVLTVGSSSITISSGSITIKSPQIKFEQG
jgi:hypothetical protein